MQTQRIVEGDRVKTSHHPGTANLISWGQQPKCSRCNRPANKGKPYCAWHGKYSVKRPSQERVQARALDMMAKLGLLPGELVALPVWQGLARMSVAPRARNQMPLVLLWAKRNVEPLAWAQAWRNASHAVGAPRAKA